MIDCTDCTKQIGSRSEPMFVDNSTQAIVCRSCYRNRVGIEPEETDAQFEQRSYGETSTEQIKNVLLGLHDNLRGHIGDDLWDEGYTSEEIDNIIDAVQKKLIEAANAETSR